MDPAQQDTAVRKAAFDWLDEQQRRHGDVLPRGPAHTAVADHPGEPRGQGSRRLLILLTLALMVLFERAVGLSRHLR